MWDPDLTPPPDDHDPWAWRAGVAVFGLALLIWHIFPIVSFFGWIVGSAIFATVVGCGVHEHRRERKDEP